MALEPTAGPNGCTVSGDATWLTNADGPSQTPRNLLASPTIRSRRSWFRRGARPLHCAAFHTVGGCSLGRKPRFGGVRSDSGSVLRFVHLFAPGLGRQPPRRAGRHGGDRSGDRTGTRSSHGTLSTSPRRDHSQEDTGRRDSATPSRSRSLRWNCSATKPTLKRHSKCTDGSGS